MKQKNPQNQLHKPRKLGENNPVHLRYKCGESTMLLTKELNFLEATCLVSNINRFMARKNKKLYGHFIFTR